MSLSKSILSFIVIVLFLHSCKSTRYVASTSMLSLPAGSVEQAYIDLYKDLAINEMNRSGIPASITLAQGMVESDYGRSTLARDANNHFGIKCHTDWTGPTVRHDDDSRNECFRKYRRADESFRDHSDFLMTGSRYSFLFDLSPTDYKGWAKGLKRAGYATNPRYADMLIEKIEQLGLHQYDIDGGSRRREVPSAQREDVNVVETQPSRIMERNMVEYIVVREGETVGFIEKEFDLLGWELARYNELEADMGIYPGQILYLQPKRNRAGVGNETHIVAEGETLYLISQQYGVKLDKLREYNLMPTGEEPEVGDTVWLRGLRPVR